MTAKEYNSKYLGKTFVETNNAEYIFGRLYVSNGEVRFEVDTLEGEKMTTFALEDITRYIGTSWILKRKEIKLLNIK